MAAFKILSGCWPNANPHDPKIYKDAVVALFRRYPPAAVARVCDPLGGLPSKLSFLPTIHDLTAALEDEMRPIYEAQRERKTKELLEAHRAYPITKEEKARVAALADTVLKALSEPPGFEEDESQDIRDHIAKYGTMSYASAMKFKLKPTGYARRPSR